MATRKFLRDEDITIERLEKRLDKIIAKINENNKMNLTDANIYCEEIFGELFNRLLGLKLVSTSIQGDGRFIAVDLIDYE